MRSRTIYPLAIAYACNPYKGSEHGVGWGWVNMIAESHDVHVIAAEFESEDIERWLDEHPEYRARMTFHFPAHKHWHYHKESRAWAWVEHSPLKIIMNWAYRIWQQDAYRLARKLHSEVHFDLCHLITYVGFRFPGQFHKLDCPLVWGPIGGLGNTPSHFMPLLGCYGAVYYTFRNWINTFDKKYLKNPRRAFLKASKTGSVIAATSGIQREIRKWYGVDSTVICEIGPPSIGSEVKVIKRTPTEPLRICWSGEHLPGKALQLLLKALARLPSAAEWRLDVLGEGPLTECWKKQTEELGINSNCIFLGKVPRVDALELMQRSHLFVITSLKDLTSTVLLEALSLGKPVIAPDHCGFSDVITEECGIKIPIDDIDLFIGQLSAAIQLLYDDEPHRKNLAQGALERIKHYDWDSKSETLIRIYEKGSSESRFD